MDVAANRHDLTYRFHRGGQYRLGPFELFKGKTRDFGDDIVNRRFKRRGGRARNVIVNFVERIAHCQLCRDLGDREAGGFGSQRRRSATRAGSFQSRSGGRPWD